MSRVLVLGGGLAGMTVAKALAGSHDVRVLEQEDRLGGLLRTFRGTVDGVGEFRFDIGGHWLHRDGFSGVADLFSGLVEHERHAFVYVNGKHGRFPIQAFYDDVFDGETAVSICEELANRTDDQPRSYADMLQKSYGETLFDRFFEPYNRKLFGVPDLTPISFGELELVRNVRVGDKAGYNSTFLYPDGQGIESLIEDLKDDRVEYILDEMAVHVDTQAHIVTCADGTPYTYDVLVSTVPLDMLTAMVGEPLYLLGSQGLVMNMGVKKNPNHVGKNWVYYPDDGLPFYRVGLYSEADPTAAPEGYVAMYVEVSTLRPWTNAEVMLGLQKVGMIESPTDVVLQQAAYLPTNYCFADPRVPGVLQAFRLAGVHSIGRYGSWHWSSMHEDVKQALELAERIR